MPKGAQRHAARAFWSGTITFGLVSIPVDLYAAVQARDTSMRMVDAKGNPLGRQYYCPEDGKTLDSGEMVRGYEIENGKIVVVQDEELEAIAPEMTRDIELRRFVARGDIPSAYFNRPYFLAPTGRSQKAYHLLAATMEATGRVGIGTFVMRGHQHLVAILPDGGILRAETLRFADELRSPEDVGLPKRRKPSARAVKGLAKAIRELKSDELDTNELSDWYAGEIHELVAQKEKQGKDVVDYAEADAEETDEGGAEVIDLMNLLKKRLGATGRRPPQRSSGRKSSATGRKRKKTKKAA